MANTQIGDKDTLGEADRHWVFDHLPSQPGKFRKRRVFKDSIVFSWGATRWVMVVGEEKESGDWLHVVVGHRKRPPSSKEIQVVIDKFLSGMQPVQVFPGEPYDGKLEAYTAHLYASADGKPFQDLLNS